MIMMLKYDKADDFDDNSDYSDSSLWLAIDMMIICYF